jgi:hypothetical protein
MGRCRVLERSTSQAMNFYLGGGICFRGQCDKTCAHVSIGLISDYFGVWPKVIGFAVGSAGCPFSFTGHFALGEHYSEAACESLPSQSCGDKGTPQIF